VTSVETTRVERGPPSSSRVPKKDPSMRKDGKCFVCQKPLPGVAVTHGDPFCSTLCARSFYELDVRASPTVS
jgi:hypothetical protein